MSAIKQPDFYIGVTRDPPAIVSIGKTIDGMEVIDVVLLNSELNEEKKRVLKMLLIILDKPSLQSQIKHRHRQRQSLSQFHQILQKQKTR